MTLPPLGPYWAARQVPEDAPLDHFRRGLSSQFDNAARLQEEEHVRQRWRTFAPLISREFYPLLEDSPKGDPPRYPLLGYQASVSSIEFAAMASSLIPLIWGARVRSVNEIGGGYGGLCAAIHAYPGVRTLSWTIVDIPATARVARWYLREVLSAEVLDLDQVDRLAPADLVVQTRGFMEMSPEELAFYFSRIQDGRLLRPGGFFWMINRRAKISRMRDYPFDERWEVLRVAPWPEADMLMVLLNRTPDARGPVAPRLGL